MYILQNIYPNCFHNIQSHLVIQVVTTSRRLRWAGHVARMEEGRSALKILTGNPTGKRGDA